MRGTPFSRAPTVVFETLLVIDAVCEIFVTYNSEWIDVGILGENRNRFTRSVLGFVDAMHVILSAPVDVSRIVA